MAEVFRQYRIINCNHINVRHEPSINAKVACVLDAGQTVQVVVGGAKQTKEINQTTGKHVTITWAKIKSNENRLWISAAYLEPVANYVDKLINAAAEIGAYMVSNRWHYQSGSFGTANTWDKAKACGKKTASCSAYVSWCAQLAGLLNTGKQISHTPAGAGTGAKAVKYASNLKHCKVTYPNKRWDKCGLRAGDILIYDSNICIYDGNGRFYDAGGPFSANCDKSKSGKNRYIAIPSRPQYDLTEDVLAVIRPDT